MTAFDCGDQSLNDFLCTEEVANYEKEWLGKTTLAYCEGSLAGYYTICYGQLRKEYLQTWKSFTKLGEYHVDSVPAMVVGRLAVDKKWQNKGIGRTTMQRIAMLALDNSAHSGLRLLLVQAKEDAFGFYEKLGFEYATEVKEEMKRYKARGTRTMFFDLSALDYLKTR